MARIVSTGLALALGFALAGPARADNPCGNADRAPEIFSAKILEQTGPGPDGEVHVRAEIVTDQCTYLAAVRHGLKFVPWLVRNENPDDPSRSLHVLDVELPKPSEDSTEVVTVLVGRSGGIASVTVELYCEKITAKFS